MQFEKRFKDAIRDGRVNLSFRAWKRPQVKVGGRYRVHPIGLIEVDALARCRRGQITASEARRAGFESRAALFAYLERKSDAGQWLYRVEFHYAGDGKETLHHTGALPGAELQALRSRLERMDRLSRRGPWTARTLQLIGAHPATRAGDLADQLGWETPAFKANVRKLKKLGLTLSLETGYRLSARGAQLVDQLSE